MIFCFGVLHRVEHPLGLLRVLRGCLGDGGRVLVETYGVADDDGSPVIRVHAAAPARGIRRRCRLRRRSLDAVAVCVATGEVVRRRFGGAPGLVIEWLKRLPGPDG